MATPEKTDEKPTDEKPAKGNGKDPNPTPAAPEIPAGFALVPIPVLTHIQRLLGRIGIDGGEASELSQALGQSARTSTPGPAPVADE